ncbi:MAG TPA: hypothetical protein VMR19_04455 [Candidatus Saccharimonadales bacterium]|jgi:glutathione synthase/RimK-type ligase-like ATP-grasp enzyme|nr:hypothetical protein [Candidatus Saccharimonadales bacterium]
MKKILILVSKYGTNLDLAKFIENDLKDKTRVFYNTFSDVRLSISRGKLEAYVKDIDLGSFDLVYFRRTGKKYLFFASALAMFLEEKGIPYIDPVFKNLGPSGNKLCQLVKLGLADLPVIPSLYISNFDLEKNVDEIEKKFGYPVIAKKLGSHHSRGIYSIKTREDFINLPKNDSGYIFQKLIQIESEFRLLVLGGRVATVQKMKRDLSDFRALIDYSAKEVFLSLDKVPEQMKSFAEKAAEILKLDIAGADLCIEKGTGTIWIFEINRGPGLTPDQKISPEFREISKFILNKIIS